MKMICSLLTLLLCLQSVSLLACDKHTDSNEDQKVSHCEQMAMDHDDQQGENKKSESECPVCEMGLCFESQAATFQEISLTSEDIEVKKVLLKQLLNHFISIKITSNYYYPPDYYIPLPRSKNWQSYYSIFLI